MTTKKDKWIKAAESIAVKICRDAIWDGNRCTWLRSDSEQLNGYSKTFFHSMGADFYSGVSGTALFLSSVANINSDKIIEATAKGALEQVISTIGKLPNSIGLFSGKSGAAASIEKCGILLKDYELMLEGKKMVKQIFSTFSAEPGLDIIEGYAGAIILASDYARNSNDDIYKDVAVKMGQYILSESKKEQTGISWNTSPYSKHNLTGYAHGAAGIAAALIELYEITGDQKWADAAAKAIAYENSHFIAAEKNWPDYRKFPGYPETDQTVCSCAWCHGAPGIGLSRLRLFEITNDKLYLSDAKQAIETTCKFNTIKSNGNFSLCHGLFGNADLFIEASRILKDNSIAEAEKAGDWGLQHYIDQNIPFLNGLNNSFDNPEMMTGTAGIGYFYLRLYDCVKFPSLLSCHIFNPAIKAAGEKNKAIAEMY